MKCVAGARFAVVLVCWLWLLCGCGGSTFDYLGEDEWCVVIVVFVVVAPPPSSWWWASGVRVVCPSVVGLVVVVVVKEVVGRIGCLSLLLTKSLSAESHSEPSCVVREPSRVVREVFLASDDSWWLWACMDVVFPSLGRSSLLPIPFLLCWCRWVPVGDEFCPASFVALGQYSSLFPTYPARSGDPRRDSICCQQVVCLVSCSCYAVADPGSSSSSSSSFGTSPKEGLPCRPSARCRVRGVRRR